MRLMEARSGARVCDPLLTSDLLRHMEARSGARVCDPLLMSDRLRLMEARSGARVRDPLLTSDRLRHGFGRQSSDRNIGGHHTSAWGSLCVACSRATG